MHYATSMSVCPLRDTVYPFTFLCIHLYVSMFILHVCVHPCVHRGHSLITLMAWIGEGLKLDSWVCDFLSSLELNDSPINVFLQVHEAPVVAQRLPGRDVCILHKVGVTDPVSAHDIVHMHADSVADFGRQGGRGGGGPCLPG